MAGKRKELSVEPTKGLAPWAGGKKELAAALVDRIEATSHLTYAEPFVGMGGVFLRRRRRAHVEVVNDRSGEVVNLFRIVKHHAEAFLEELRLQIHSRDEFERMLATAPETLTDVQRAARFYWLQRCRYSGLPISRTFPVAAVHSKAVARAAVERHIVAAHRRLERVTIENLPYGEFIDRYDRPRTLFYLDPPYFGNERIYGKGLFERADFARLAEQLGGIKGRFILSLNDAPEIRRVFGRFRIEEVPVLYRINRTHRTKELIISGPRRRR